MRLDPDCIRDILLEVEENTSFGKYFTYNPNENNTYPRLKNYDSETVLYHIKQCDMDGYLVKVSYYMNRSCLIQDLSPEAHRFLADVRDDNNWNKTKNIAQKVGSESL